MKKTIWYPLLASSLVLTLAACGPKEESEVPPTESEEVVKEVQPVKTEPTEPIEVVQEEATEMYTSTGIYLGKKDQNSVEIKTNEGTAVYQLSEDVQGVLTSLKPNASITFDHYKTSDGNITLASITINDPVEKETVTKDTTEEWVFIGLIDGHSAEFTRGGEFIVASYGGNLEMLNKLAPNDVVLVKYVNDANGQPKINTITKK